MFFLSLFILLIASFISLNDAKKESEGFAKKNPKPPEVILLSERPKPLTVEVPIKAGGFYLKKGNKEETKIELVPPEKTPPPIFYPMQTFSTGNGLIHDGFFSGAVDRAGNLWLGTDGAGAFLYDGQSFTNYNVSAGIPHAIIRGIKEDKKGNIWFATDGGGASKYDGKFFTIYSIKSGLPSDLLRGVLEDSKGNLWFSSYGGGVSKFDGTSFTNYTTAEGLANNKVFGMAEDRKGNLWFATEGGGASKFDGESFSNYTVANGLAGDNVRAILEDRNGNLWFGTELSGVSKYDGKSFITYTTNDGLVNNGIWHIMEDKRGHIWFGTEDGVSEYDGQSFTNFTKANGLTFADVRSILEDKEGYIWFLSYGGGIYKYGGKFITEYLMSHLVRTIAEDTKGNLWFGVEGGGVYEYDGKSFINYTVAQGLPNNKIWSSVLDNTGKIWFGSEGGATVYDGKSFTTYTTEQGLTGNWIWSIRQDKEGNLWFSTNNYGVSKFDGKSFTNYTTEQGLVNNAVRTSLVDKNGNLWFGTNGGGVSKYDGKEFVNYTTADGLNGDHIWDILEDDAGNIWFANTNTGISRFDGSSFQSYSIEDGLPDNGVVQLVITKENHIAIGTQNGIAILTGFSDASTEMTVPAQNHLKNEELKKYKPVFEIYRTTTGYPLKDTNGGQNGMFLDSKGILWIGQGSKKSLARVDYSALNKSTEPPAVLIQRLKINNENVIWTDLLNIPPRTKDGVEVIPSYITEEMITLGTTLSENKREEMREKFGKIQFGDLTKFSYIPENLKIPHAFNNITVDFGAIEPSLPEDVLYQYKLEGYNKDWSPPSNNSIANFGNIFEGNYQLKIKAQSPFGVWSNPITYNFTVLPPWYRTWWAYSLYALSSLMFVYLILLWRTATLRKRQKQLEQTVTERTLELVNEKKKSDKLLLNILPVQVAEELKEKGNAHTQAFESVTILFTDFKNFTKVTEVLPPKELVEQIDYCYRGFEKIINKYNIEKIKTIGDSFMAVGGLPVPNTTHPKDVVSAALEIIKFMKEYERKRKEAGKEVFGIRIGIHTGPVIAGVVGSNKFAYDIWGDAVNMASRMESSDEEGKVNISKSTYQLVKDDFNFFYRGKIAVKGKGEIDMYFVTEKTP